MKSIEPSKKCLMGVLEDLASIPNHPIDLKMFKTTAEEFETVYQEKLQDANQDTIDLMFESWMNGFIDGVVRGIDLTTRRIQREFSKG